MCPHQSDDIVTLLQVPKGTRIFRSLDMMVATDGAYTLVEESMYFSDYFSTALTLVDGQWIDAVGFTEGDQLWYAFPETVYLCREYI